MAKNNFPSPSVVIDNQITIKDISVIIEVEEIDVTRAVITEPNMKWTTLDSAGHFHAFSRDERDQLPTLETESIEHSSCGYDHEDCSWTETIYRCRLCGDVIEPEWNSHSNAYRETAPGPMSWKIEISTNTPSIALALHRKHHERVSVRFFTPDGTTQYFGFGLLSTTAWGRSNAEGAEYHGSIFGIGPMGSRIE